MEKKTFTKEYAVRIGIFLTISGFILGSLFTYGGIKVVRKIRESNTSSTAVTKIVQTTQTPTLAVSGNAQNITYENERMKLTVPSTWNYKFLDTMTPISINNYNLIEHKNGGIVLVKGNYTLNIIAFSSGQTSGINGGRFSDIAGYYYDNLKIDPINCPIFRNSHDVKLNDSLYRLDGYYDSSLSDTKDACGNPTKNGNLWYGSYVHTTGSTFTDYAKVINSNKSKDSSYDLYDQMVITMSYYTKNVNDFPLKDDTGLNTVLNEMSDIVKSVQFKTVSGY